MIGLRTRHPNSLDAIIEIRSPPPPGTNGAALTEAGAERLGARGCDAGGRVEGADTAEGMNSRALTKADTPFLGAS